MNPHLAASKLRRIKKMSDLKKYLCLAILSKTLLNTLEYKLLKSKISIFKIQRPESFTHKLCTC